MVTVTTKYSGWVEKVYVNYVGEPVKKGQPLFEIYSPELVQTEQELLSAIEYAKKFDTSSTEAGRRASALVDSARERLRYWDISLDQIDNLERTGEVFRTLQVVAPASGLVMKRMPGLEGMAVRPGMEVYHIADLRSLWLSVEVFEHQVAQIDIGSMAEVELTYFPGRGLPGDGSLHRAGVLRSYANAADEDRSSQSQMGGSGPGCSVPSGSIPRRLARPWSCRRRRSCGRGSAMS